MKVGRVAGVGLSAGAMALYRGAKGVAKQNSPFRRQWEEHLLATVEALNDVADRGEELPLIYMALGDSAAQGLGATNFEEGYVPRIAAALRQTSGRDVALLNISLSGGTAASVLGTQIPQLNGMLIGGQPIIPDILTLDIGGNDVGVTDLSIEDFGVRMDRIVAQLPQPAVIANIPTFKPLRTEKRASALSLQIERAARKYGAGVVRLEELSNTFGLWEYMTHYHAPDMFHPNSAWYERWAQLFMDEISAELGLPSVDMAEVPVWEPWQG